MLVFGPVVPVSAVSEAPQSDESVAPESLSSIDDIVTKAREALLEIHQLQVVVDVEQYNPTDGSVTFGKGKLSALMPDLFRLDWLQPDMMAGSILTIDRAENEARQYNPIREEIIVQSWERLAAENNFTADIDRWLSIPDPDDYDLELAGIEHDDEQPYYVVLARPKEDPRQLYEFFLHPETWLVRQFRYHDVNGHLSMVGRLTNVQVDAGITENTLRTMPRATIRHR